MLLLTVMKMLRVITMTRINCIPVTELVGKHLVAEYRELPRVFTLAGKSFNKHMNLLTGTLTMPKAPPEYTLGTGHVVFFYRRLEYLYNRYLALVKEMQARGYKPNVSILNSVTTSYALLPDTLKNDWEPTEEAMAINRARIAERLA